MQKSKDQLTSFWPTHFSSDPQKRAEVNERIEAFTISSSPTITIAVAAYNVRRYIGACLKSILLQSIPADEVLVINDGSTDETTQIIDEYKRIYPQLTIYHKENSGLCGVRKFALEKATCDYIWFFDGDDILAEDAILHFKSAARKHAMPDIIQGGRVYFYGKKKWKAKYYKMAASQERVVTLETFPELIYLQSVGCKIISRKLLEDLELDGCERIMSAEDHLITMHCYKKYPKHVLLNKDVVFYRRENPGSGTLTANIFVFQDLLEVLKIMNQRLDKSLKRIYFKRFLQFDLLESALGRFFNLPKELQITAFQLAIEMVAIIPSDIDASVYGKINRRILITLRQNNYSSFRIWQKYKIHVYPIVNNIRRHVVNKIFNSIIKKILSCPKWLRINSNIVYKLFSILPTKKDSVVFCIRPAVGTRFFEPVLSMAKKESMLQVSEFLPDTTTWPRLLKCYKELAVASVLVLDSQYGPLFGIAVRKETSVVQVWHSGGIFKKFGCDMGQLQTAAAKAREKNKHISYTDIVVSSPEATPHYATAFSRPISCMRSLGTLKSDNLYKVKENLPFIRERFYEAFPKTKNKKVILYAPTYREEWDQKKIVGDKLHLNMQTFAERFGEQYTLLLRTHPNFSVSNDVFAYGTLDATSYPEAELLACTDILISDYSSIIFDYAFFGKPMIFYAYDLADYLQERGFYIPYREFVPGPVCINETELYETIEHIPNSCPDSKLFWDKYMTHCDGRVAEKLLELIKTLAIKNRTMDHCRVDQSGSV